MNDFQKIQSERILSLYKSKEIDLEKGGKRAVVGEVRTYSGQKWVKHTDGWVHVSDKKKILEKPGGKRETASDHHIEHFHTHSRRHDRETVEGHHRRLHQAGIENLKTQDFKVHAKYGDNTGGRESLETNFELFPKQNPDRGPEEHRLVKLKNDSSFTSTAHAIMTKERAERSVQEDRGEIVGYFDKDGRFNETGEKEEPTKTDLSPVELLNKKTKELSAVQDKLDDHHKGIKELEDSELKALKDKKDILVQVVKKLEAKSKVSDKVPEDKKAAAAATKDVKSEESGEEVEKLEPRKVISNFFKDHSLLAKQIKNMPVNSKTEPILDKLNEMAEKTNELTEQGVYNILSPDERAYLKKIEF